MVSVRARLAGLGESWLALLVAPLTAFDSVAVTFENGVFDKGDDSVDLLVRLISKHWDELLLKVGEVVHMREQ